MKKTFTLIGASLSLLLSIAGFSIALYRVLFEKDEELDYDDV